MDRKETIKALQNIGAKLAKEYGYCDVIIGEDRQKGFWGEKFTEYLKEKYGECTQEITWCNGNSKEERINFRFRFFSPCLSIRQQGEVFAEIELSDYVYETKEHSGDFKLAQTMTWKPTGMKLLHVLLDEWDRYNKTIVANTNVVKKFDQVTFDREATNPNNGHSDRERNSYGNNN